MPIEDQPFPKPETNQQTNPASTGCGPIKPLSAIIGPSVLGKDGSRIPANDISAAVIGLYFSAHWCPPCRAFTPVLASVYRNATTQKKSFEVIFCSQDKNVEDFQQYWSTMPWMAIPFENRRQVVVMAQNFRVVGIPALVLINTQGQLVNAQAVRDLRLNPMGFTEQLPRVIQSKVPINEEELHGQTVDIVLERLAEAVPPSSRREGMETLVKILENITSNPNNRKFHCLKKSNKNVQQKLEAVDHGFLVLLKLAGFVEYKDTYEFVPTTENKSKVEELMSLLNCIVMSMGDNNPPTQNSTGHEPEGDGDSKWVCEGDFCRRME